MWGTILATAVPLVATLAAAFYIVRKISQSALLSDDPHERNRTVGNQTDMEYASGGLTSGQRNLPSNRRNHQAKRNEVGEPVGLNIRRRNPQSSRPGGSNIWECEICFESKQQVKLYPCCHSNICENCVIKIVSNLDRTCPFCRRYIQAYESLVL